MDIDAVEGEMQYDEDAYGYYDVGEVWLGTQCHTSGGYGHMARDCPSKGKGDYTGKDKCKGKDNLGGAMWGKGAK